jgi:uncharacterized protein
MIFVNFNVCKSGNMSGLSFALEGEFFKDAKRLAVTFALILGRLYLVSHEGCRMNREQITATLRQHETELRRRGVAHAALFGSRVRGDNRVGSGTDIMIEIDPEAHITVFDYAGLKDYISSLFDGSVDVVNRDGLKPYIRPAAAAEAVYAF